MAVLVVWLWDRAGNPFPENPDALFGTAATVASVLASFLGVSKAIVLTIKSTRTFALLKDKGYTLPLFSFLRSGVFCSILFAAASILAFFINHSIAFHGVNIFEAFCVVWIYLGAAAFFTYLRISNILFKLLSVA